MHLELLSLEKITQMVARGFRVIEVKPAENEEGILPDQGILLAAVQAYLASVRDSTYSSKPFAFLVDIRLYQGAGEINYPTLVIELENLLEAA